jgi:hypothetical protein
MFHGLGYSSVAVFAYSTRGPKLDPKTKPNQTKQNKNKGNKNLRFH